MIRNKECEYPELLKPGYNPFDSDLQKPFLRWAGGKQKLIKKLLRYFPDDFRIRRYREPFLGAGSLFFTLRPANSIISDSNHHLMECYKMVRAKPIKIAYELEKLGRDSSCTHYYEIRNKYSIGKISAIQAARFIYLNRTCFNGIFRVNLKDQFNVPYGYKKSPVIPSEEHLLYASSILTQAEMNCESFDGNLPVPEPHDFFYLDPPYPPLNGTSYFTHYTKDRFSNNDHCRLAEYVKSIDKAGAKFLMTNASVQLIESLYKEYNIARLAVPRWISCKKKKHKVYELVITNYDSGYDV